ncbi:unnamed protein product [Sphenostylis stenocarpa]|uniref:Uncharacterized protein n=1 Tax=Sphenostylis stenocarpa TaxID=92480 RepID=A0AA86RRG4_9FABA|nr:unnamed protein product [Sphenostylis stenocarpa]
MEPYTAPSVAIQLRELSCTNIKVEQISRTLPSYFQNLEVRKPSSCSVHQREVIADMYLFPDYLGGADLVTLQLKIVRGKGDEMDSPKLTFCNDGYNGRKVNSELYVK